MMYLFSNTGARVLESLSFTRALYAFDFDGTLAPIVSSPTQAGASTQTAKLLLELQKYADVAIISGRSVADLKARVTSKKISLVGNHGLEGLGLRKESAEMARQSCASWEEQLRKSWRSLENDPGVFVEGKTYSLALHYRQSRNKNLARTQLLDRISGLNPTPRVILGKCVMNLVPAGAPHKGVALLELMMRKQSTCAFYIGDDDTDEDVFSLPDSKIVTVRVGQKRLSQAQFFIRRQPEINRLLRMLLRLHQR